MNRAMPVRKIVKAEKTLELRESVRKFVVDGRQGVEGIGGNVLDVCRAGDGIAVTIEDCDDGTIGEIKKVGGDSVREVRLNLDEIFEAYVVGNRGDSQL